MPETLEQPQITVQDLLEGISTHYFIGMFLHIKGVDGQKVNWIPFPEQVKMLTALDNAAKEKQSVFWLMKTRQGAGTSMVAARAMKKCMGVNGYKILVLSKSGDQAEKFLADRVVQTLEWMREHRPDIPWPTYKAKAGKVTFSNGSTLEAINSALSAGRGDTVDEVILDEAAAGEFMHHFEPIWGSISGTVEHSSTGLIVVLSTAEPGTPFNIRSKEYYQHPKPGIHFYFMGINAIPPHIRTPEWREKRIANLNSITRFKLEYPETIKDCFVTDEGFGFPQLENPPGRHVMVKPIDNSLIFGCTYDHGRTKEHPAAIWWWQFDRFKDHLHIFQEQYWFEPPGGLGEITAGINADYHKIRADHKFLKPTRCIADTAITNNDGRQSIRDIIRDKTGIYFNPAHKYDEKQSLDHFINRVNDNRVSFNPSCVHSIRQISEILWDTKKDNYGKLVDLDNEAIDLGRYTDADLRLNLPKKEEFPMPPRYTKKNRIWREQTSIKNIDINTRHKDPWGLG